MSRRYPWSREENILALDLYFQSNRTRDLKRIDPKFTKLSKAFRQLYPDRAKQDKEYRNPTSIRPRLDNFKALDPDWPGVGLKNYPKSCEAIFNEFSENRDGLKRAVDSIRSDVIR